MTVLVLLSATTARGVIAVGRPTSKRWGLGLAGALVVLAGVWLGVNRPMEGPVVWELTPRHGVTAADLLAVPALAVAGLLVLRVRLATGVVGRP